MLVLLKGAFDFCWITLEQQDVFFHIKNVQIEEESIYESMSVFCRVVPGRKGNEAVEVYALGPYIDEEQTVYDKERQRIYVLGNAHSNELELTEIMLFDNGTKYARKGEHIIERGEVPEDADIATLIETGGATYVSNLHNQKNSIRIIDGEKGKVLEVGEPLLDKVVQMNEISLGKGRSDGKTSRRGKMELDKTGTKGILIVDTQTTYEEEDDNTRCRVAYYGGLYEDMFSKSATYEDMYKTHTVSESYTDTYEVTLENGLRSLLEDWH